MKKLYMLLAVIACLIVCVIGFDTSSRIRIINSVEKSIYDNTGIRNGSDYAMDKVLNESSILVLGSSELSSVDDVAFPEALFNEGHSDFNMILVGAGYSQSLVHAINICAYQDNIKNSKVVLIVSPQWFTPSGLTADAFSSRFTETNYVEFLQNDDITYATKTAIAKRVDELLVSDQTTLDRVKKYEEIYLNHSLNPLLFAEMSTYNAFINAKYRFEDANRLEERRSGASEKITEAQAIDWELLLDEAETRASQECTTNQYGIYDDYYNLHIAESYESLSGYLAGGSYTSSPEYDDLRLFLDVCKEMNIEPLIVNIPVNGRWYDYCEFSRADRNTYYQNIREICDEYDVAIADFSDKEYELYFLRDTMHLGWKGWVYLDEAVYDFYCGNELTNNAVYNVISLDHYNKSENVTVSDGSIFFSTSTNGNAFDSVVFSIAESDTIIDLANCEENRSGLYFHDEESGNYTIRLRANSNLADEFIEYTVVLEKGAVYKFEYNVENLDGDNLTVSDFSFFEIIY